MPKTPKGAQSGMEKTVRKTQTSAGNKKGGSKKNPFKPRKGK